MASYLASLDGLLDLGLELLAGGMAALRGPSHL
jgi:hypothetical protein